MESNKIEMAMQLAGGTAMQIAIRPKRFKAGTDQAEKVNLVELEIGVPEGDPQTLYNCIVRMAVQSEELPLLK